MTSIQKKLKESEERFKALFKGGPYSLSIAKNLTVTVILLLLIFFSIEIPFI
ncbi:hypothetical protein ES703_121817 [subsurface metagenome]